MKRALASRPAEEPRTKLAGAEDGRERPIIRSLDRALFGPDRRDDNGAPAAPAAQRKEDHVYFVKDARGLVRLDTARILYLKAEGNYVELHTPDRRVVLRNSLAEVLKMLPEGLMCQVNRAEAVNMQHVERITADEVVVDKRVFTLSKSYRAALMAGLKIISAR